MFSREELERYNRHFILPEIGLAGQEKLKQARVLVIGAGGLGCPVLQYLTAAGVGTLGICDFDYIDASNLQRQILYSISDLGKPKALVAAERLTRINPYVDFEVHNLMLTKENVFDVFSPYDIIVDGSDNFPTRFLINDACEILGKPLVFGAIYKFEGQVSVFNYQGGPGYRNVVPEEPDSGEAPSCSQIGVLGVIPGLIGCYQAMEVVKIICGTGKVLSGKMLILDALNLVHTIIDIVRDKNSMAVKELGKYGDFCMNQYAFIRQLKPHELYEFIKRGKAIAVDIREAQYFKNYHMDSLNIPVSNILEGNLKLPESEMLVIVCELGINSMALIDELLKTTKHLNLYNLEGGIQAWIKQGLPIITNE
jgi:sulfur-carrier protein adenylyltransferase/sulfurtransferase